MRYIWLIALMALAGVLRAERPMFQGELDVTGVTIHEEHVSYRISGTFDDGSVVGFTALDIATNDLVSTEAIIGHVDIWQITNIVARSASVITADVVYAQSGTSTVGMVAGIAAVFTLSTNNAGFPQQPSITGARVSEHMLNEVRNWSFRRMDSYTRAQADALLAGKAGTGTVAAIDGRVTAVETQYVRTVNSITGRVQIAGGTNITVIDDGTNITINASGGGTGSATNWYAYEQLGLIYRSVTGSGTNAIIANSGTTNEFTLNYLGSLYRNYEGVDAAGRTNYIFREYNQYNYGSGGTNWLWYYEEAEPPHDTVYYAHMTNAAAFPTGTWYQGDAAQEPPLTPSGDTTDYDWSVTNTFGYNSAGTWSINHGAGATVTATSTGVDLTVPITAPNLGTASAQDTDDFAAAAHQHAYTAITNPPWLTSMSLGTGPTDAYPGDVGNSVSGRADQAYTASTQAQAAAAAAQGTADAALPKSGGTMTGPIDMGGKAITDCDYISTTNITTKLRIYDSQTTNRLAFSVTGVGFRPKGLVCNVNVSSTPMASWSQVDSTGYALGFCQAYNGVTFSLSSGDVCRMVTAGGAEFETKFISWDADGASFSNYVTGSVTTNAVRYFMLFYR